MEDNISKTGLNQEYDKILKESIKKALPALLQKLCGLKARNIVALPTTLTQTKERRMDYVFRIVADKPSKDEIVHIEFQAKNEKLVPKRMFEYYDWLFQEYDSPIRQFVFYIGEGKMRMKNVITHPNLSFRFTIINFNELDVNIFLNSDKPEEVILSILCHFPKEDAPKIIRQIIENIHKIETDSNELQKFAYQLRLLSNIRKLQPEVIFQQNKLNNMPLIIDIEQDYLFKKGEKKGELEKERTLVVKHLTNGIFTIEQIADFVDVPLKFVLKIQKELNQQKIVKK